MKKPLNNKPHFLIRKCAKTRLHSNVEYQKFPGEDPRTPTPIKGKVREGTGK
jgi:hypothetical protein